MNMSIQHLYMGDEYGDVNRRYLQEIFYDAESHSYHRRRRPSSRNYDVGIKTTPVCSLQLLGSMHDASMPTEQLSLVSL